MSARRWSRAVLLVTVGSLTLATSAGATKPSTPVAANDKPVRILATGLPTPTAFAFTRSTVFVGLGPKELGGPGGLFVLSAGKAKMVPHTPQYVYGLVWHSNTLYVSTGPTIVTLSGWNGTKFKGKKTIYKGKKGFPGFNGLAFGPDGRLYANLALAQQYDHTKDPFPLSQAVVSMTAAGKQLRIVARGLRQPFQLTFPQGSPNPYVTILGQDEGTIPLDQIVVAKSGQNYGFPSCIWLVEQSTCKGFDKPLIFLPQHASPMGISSIGKTLYVALFGGTGKGPEVVTIPTEGGTPQPFVTGFPAPVIGLGIHSGSVYVGDIEGTIYKIAT